MPGRIAALLLVLALCACRGGGGAPVSPTQVATTPDTGFPAGAVINIVSGETGMPVAGAALSVGGRPTPADAVGRVTLSERLDLNTPIDVAAPGHLDRVTRLRSRDPIALWPKQSPTGLDEHFSATIVYTATGDDSQLAGNALLRLAESTRQVFVVPSVELVSDAATMEALTAAAARVTAANGGQLTHLVDANPPSGAVRFDARLDPSQPTCASGFRAFVSWSLRGSTITGGLITFCSAAAARSATATHEMGHTYGLRHSPDTREVMYRAFATSRASDFSQREALVMRLMLLRPPGNRSPDSDRDVVVSTQRRTLTIVCAE